MSTDSSGDNQEYILVTEYFHPDTASTGQLMTELAVGLRERGLNLSVYTGQPNYHSGKNERQPSFSIHEGVPVRRIRAPQVRQSSLPRRLFNWAVFTVWMSLALLIDRPTQDREIVFVTCPPFLPVAMWAVCRLRGWEYTYIAYDLYPDEPAELGYIRKGGLLHRGWESLDMRAFRDATRIVALGPVMKSRITRKVGPGFDESKVEIIHNWVDEEFIIPREKSENWFSQEHDLVEPFTILYSGNMAAFHDLETVVEAAAALDPGLPVKFLLIGEGDGKAGVVELAEKLDVRGDRVEFLPYQPREDLPYSLTAGDISVVTVREGFEGIVVSSKLYTSMAAGTPVFVIAQSDDDEARIVERFDAGITVAQNDVMGMVAAIERWIADPELVARQGANARKAFEEHFVKSRAVDAYHRMLTGRAASPTQSRDGRKEATANAVN
jgi:glycosyltransferase involved in cell wall biosynthesis